MDNTKVISHKKPTYPNHHILKKNRLVKLEQTNGLCEVCGAIARHVHHLDKSIDNHDLENLQALCYGCHAKLHPRGRGAIKFEFNGKEYAVHNIAGLSDVSHTTMKSFIENPEHLNINSFLKILKAMRKVEEYEMTEGKLMTADEVAGYLNCSVNTIRDKTCRDAIPHIKIPGGGIRFRKEDIDKWLIERGKENDKSPE